MTLHRGASVSGRAVSTDGKPIAGARVLAVSTSEPFPLAEPRRDGVITGKQGEWSVASVAAGSYRFVLSHPGGEDAIAAVAAIARDVDVELLVAGGVRDLDGDLGQRRPVAADVRFVASGSVGGAPRARVHRRRRAIRHPRPARRRAQVVATHASGASDLVDVDLTDAANATAILMLSIDAYRRHRGDRQRRAGARGAGGGRAGWSGNAGERERWGCAATSIASRMLAEIPHRRVASRELRACRTARNIGVDAVDPGRPGRPGRHDRAGAGSFVAGQDQGPRAL
jgi:hypothetical protein